MFVLGNKKHNRYYTKLYLQVRVKERYTDYLWMATNSESEWYDLMLHMTSRLCYSSVDPDELAQAAATQVLFHECAAIRQSVITRLELSTKNNQTAK